MILDVPLSARSLRPCRCRRAYVIGVFASDTTVPTTKAAATAGAETITDLRVMADQQQLHGPVASVATAWRVLKSVDGTRLSALRAARATARERAWLARGELTGQALPPARVAGRDLAELVIDVDATLVEVHSDKQGASGHFKGGFGYHPLLAFLDNTNEALAGS